MLLPCLVTHSRSGISFSLGHRGNFPQTNGFDKKDQLENICHSFVPFLQRLGHQALSCSHLLKALLDLACHLFGDTMVQRTPTTGQTHGSTNHSMTSFAVGTNEQLPMWEDSHATRYDATGLATTQRIPASGEIDNRERVDLSIITSMYKSAPFLERFYKRVSAVASQITSNFEIIFVNDGSPDNSVEVALQLQELDPRIIIVDLSRNFGQHKAVMTALRQARGELVFRIHCDLDEPPEVLHYFYQDLKKLGVDSVFGVQEKRGGSFAKNYLGGLFYQVFNLLSPIRIPENQLSCRLMTRRYVDALLEYKEQQVYMAGLLAMVGFEQHAVTVVKKEHGTSTYTLRKRLHMMATAITSFSLRPLLVIPILGAIVFGLSILAAITGGITHLSGLLPTSGWFWVIVSIWGGTGLVISCLGIVAVYLINMMTEVKNRPYTTIRQIYKSERPHPGAAQLASTGSHSTHGTHSTQDGVR